MNSLTYKLVTLKETPKGTCRVFEQRRHENSETTSLITKFHSRTCKKIACERKWDAVLMEPDTISSREIQNKAIRNLSISMFPPIDFVSAMIQNVRTAIKFILNLLL